MIITIEIPDDEIRQEVLRLVTKRMVDELFEYRWSYDKNVLRKEMKDGLNAILRERSDEIIDRCIPHAADYIGKKGVKKLVDMIGKEER